MGMFTSYVETCRAVKKNGFMPDMLAIKADPKSLEAGL